MERVSQCLTLLFAFLLFAGCDAPEDRLHNSWYAYDEGNTEEHLTTLHQLAEENYAPALFWLGYHYAHHYPDTPIVSRDDRYALDLYLRAEALGFRAAAGWAAEVISTSGDFESRDWQKVTELRNKVSEAFPYQYANLWEDGFVVEQDLEEAINHYRFAAEKGWHRWMVELVRLLILTNKKENLIEAHKWILILEKPLQADEAPAGSEVANLRDKLTDEQLLSAREMESKILEEISWNWKARYTGVPDSPEGYHITSGDLAGFDPSKYGHASKSLASLREVAISGDPTGQFLLAALLASGGDNPTYSTLATVGPESLSWLELSAGQDYPPAVYRLARLKMLGSERADSLILLEKQMVESAKDGYGHAMRMLSFLHYDDYFSPIFQKNLVKAYAWARVHRLWRHQEVLKLKNLVVSQLNDSEITIAQVGADNFVPSAYTTYSLMPGAWPSAVWIVAGLLLCFAMLILIYLAFITVRSDPLAKKNQAVALVLFFESVVLLFVFVPYALPGHDWVVRLVNQLSGLVVFILPLLIASYFWLASMFRTSLSGFLASPYIRSLVWSAGFLVGLLTFLYFDYYLDGADPFILVLFDDSRPGLYVLLSERFNWMWVCVLFLHLYVILVLGVFFSRAPVNSQLRRQSGMYAGAYLLRFLFLGGAIGKMSWDSLVSEYGAPPTAMAITIIIYAIGELLFGIMFSFGILREQIFGIEQLFKRNLVRLVLFASVTVAFISTEQVIENFFSDEYGSIAGIIVALAMLSVHKHITGLFRGVVDRLIPDQDEISGDAATIYGHQYELAMQDGQLSSRERDMLRLTAKSLGLSRGQAEVIERQFAMT